MWIPPDVAEPTKLVFNLMDNPALIVGVWLFLISVVSSLLFAIKASKMEVVDALRYN